MSPRTFRLLDTPAASAAWNMALDAVLLEGCARGAASPSPPTVRFMRFTPPAVLIGAYQTVEAEVRTEWCREHGVDVSRRLTGGGAIYFDETQLGWEVVCRFGDVGAPGRPSEALFERLAQPVVGALRALGLDARYRPRNDIEVGGRKISGTGGTELDGALLFQGTLLVDLDVEAMVRALRVPVEKLRRQELDAMRDRVTWLSRELGARPDDVHLEGLLTRAFEEVLGLRLEPGGLTEAEARALAEALPRYEDPSWAAGRGRPGGALGKSIRPTPGGVVRAAVRTGADGERILAAMIDGDFFAYPQRAVWDLEARLKGVRSDQVAAVVAEHLAATGAELPGVGAAGITAALLEALERARGGPFGLQPQVLNSLFPVGCTLEEAVQLRPTHLLLPYCAKPVDCALRGLDDCSRCGECTVGSAYEIAAGAGLEPRSVTSFEHLISTLAELRAAGVTAYLGSCCEAFYLKHRLDLEAAGLRGLLFDVCGAETCYDLGKSSFAYRGEYRGETAVDLEVLAAVLRGLDSGRTRRG
jgi:lipoate-protein ligase A